jgi:DNA-binding HxlR family transcriptional regulator
MGRVIGTLSARWDVPTIEAIHAGYTHFNELQRKHAGINHKVLIDTLRSLQRDGFVHGPLTGADMTGYQLTELGVDLVDLVADIRWWSADRWPELTEARHRFANAVS